MRWANGWLLSAVLAVSAWGQDAKNPDEEKKKDDEAKARIAEFNKELKGAKTPKDVADKIASVLGSLKHPKILSELKGYLKHPAPDVAIEAASQMSKYEKDKDAAEGLVAGVNQRRDKESAVKLVRYAGDVGFKGISSKLVALTRHKETDVAREAVDSLAKLRTKDSIDPLLNLWRDLDQIKDDKDTGGGGGIGGFGGGGLGGNVAGTNTLADEQKKRKSDLTPAVETALEKISGEDFKTLKDAQDWWRRAKATFKEPE
jgi:hypothetical protein